MNRHKVAFLVHLVKEDEESLATVAVPFRMFDKDEDKHQLKENYSKGLIEKIVSCFGKFWNSIMELEEIQAFHPLRDSRRRRGFPLVVTKYYNATETNLQVIK